MEEALESPAELRVIAGELLEFYRTQIRPPTFSPEPSTKIWQKWVSGRRYIAGSDVAHGVGLDKSVTVVLEAGSGTVVAVVSSRSLSPLEFTIVSLSLLREYGNPTWVVEKNDEGMRVLDRAEALRYPRIFYRGNNQPGWQTNEATRPIMWGSLQEAVTSRMLISWDEELVDEFAGLIKNPDKRGRIEAVAGSNDDYCTAVGLALANRELASSQSYEPDFAMSPAFNRQGKRGAYKW